MAEKRKIKYGVSTHADNGAIFKSYPHILEPEQKDSILSRDDHTCQFCGFRSEKYQQTIFLGLDDKKKGQDDYATACVFCHQCFQVERISSMQSGALIWLPEISQIHLNHLCRAIYIARITQGPVADAAREALDILLARKDEARARLGTDDIRVMATIFQDFMEAKEYSRRNKRIQGFRILPLDRRLVREGELEFNQFPQMLAFWRSSKGPFGDIPPREWTEMFYNLKGTLSADAGAA